MYVYDKILFILTLTLFIINYSFSFTSIYERTDNLKPIVGIYTEPYPEDSDNNQSTIGYQYLAWLESYGFKVIPILYNYSKSQFDQLIPKLNGLLFMGGNRILKDISEGLFENNAKYVIELANNNKLPIWFTCQGFELLHYLIANDLKVLKPISNTWDVNLPDIFYNNVNYKSTKMFKYFSSDDAYIYQQLPSKLHYHNESVYVEAYSLWPKLNEELIITSYGVNNQGKMFVSSAESKDFNKNKYFAVQYHPEKVAFSKINNEIAHTNINTTIISKKIILGYVEEVFNNHLNKSSNNMTDEEQLKWNLLVSSEYKLNYDDSKYYFILNNDNSSNNELKFLNK